MTRAKATVCRNQGCLARNLRYERGRSIMSTPLTWSKDWPLLNHDMNFIFFICSCSDYLINPKIYYVKHINIDYVTHFGTTWFHVVLKEFWRCITQINWVYKHEKSSFQIKQHNLHPLAFIQLYQVSK